MKTTLKSWLGASTVIASLSIAVPSAYAQENEAEDSSVQDTIIVSARRRDESIIDTPVAVTAVSGDILEAAGSLDITAVQKFTPNATIEVARGSNSTLIAFIRGVGQQDPLWGFEPGVGVYVDDVFFARPQGAVLDIFDVERIEVLRGPQGTLYGRNTIGGAIKYVTKPLNMDEAQGNLRFNVGTFNQLDGIVTGSTPIGDKFAIGGALAKYTRDGYGKNLNTGAEHYNKDILAGRISAEWHPTDSFRLRFSADQTQDDSNAKHGHRRIPSADGAFQVTDIYDTNAGAGDSNSVETRGASLTAEWDINDNITLKSISAYRDSETTTPIDFDTLPQQDFDVPATYEDDQFSQEFQVQFNTDKLSGVAGVYYLDGTASGQFDVLLSSFGLTVYTAGEQEKENFALYADVSYDITDQWSISLGGRYTEDKTIADVQRDLWLGLGTPNLDPSNTSSTFLVTQTGYQGLERKDDQFTPRVSVSYEPTDEVTLYAAYSQGFKAGGFDPRARADLDPLGLSQQGFGPEIVDSYEIGAKGLFFDNKLLLNSAIFLAEYEDQQITVQQGADSDNDGINDTFVSSVFNAGKSTYSGIELEGFFNATDALTFSGNIGYIDAQIDEILSAGVNIADNFVVQNTPEWTGRFGFNYVHSMDAAGDISFNGSVAYRDEYNLFNVENDGFAAGANAVFPQGGPALDPDSATLFDASIVWTNASGGVSLGLYGSNLTDEEVPVAAYNFVTPSQLGADSAYSSFYAPPRTVMASLKLNF
ncbi:TonB-dependent receptor [Hirschia maritima]|uniref:TonB-dependent receptor n=1 Tax=Hirschia maritima TaxID=1121961 RepID=UPI0003603EAF|nr:TonB-dependent receptor [Hirschia maritima]